MEKYTLNPELEQLVKEKKLSPLQMQDLMDLKAMVDRLASCNYISDESVQEIKKKFGVKPNVITWGDYFQTEVASSHFHRDDKEFGLICQTIYFDLISSILIFTGKGEEFTRHIENEALLVKQTPRETWTIEDEEKIHLQILANYYQEMGLKEKYLTERDFDWFHGFAAAKAV